MTTLGDVITDVQRRLRSYTGQHEQSTHLTASVSADASALSVADGGAVTSGLVQVDDELIWVSATTGGSLVVPPYGRGYAGSTAAEHAADAQVVVDPFYPRVDIAQAIRDAALALYPRLFRVQTATFEFSPAVSTYDLAADADRVLDVSAETVGPSGAWLRVRRYGVDQNADTSVYASGRSITLGQAVDAGRTVRVTYASRFGTLDTADDELTDAGFSESHRDVLTLGTVYRLVQFLEPARLNLTAVANQERSQYSPVGAASALTRQLLGLYEQRIGEERGLLLQSWPVRPVRTSR